MSTFDLFISPSEREAFGMVAAEAQAAGLPCLLSNNFPDSIDMKLGLVTFLNILDPNEWAENIINSNCKRIVCKDLILNKFKELGFDVNNNILKVESVYRSNDL
jgi:glycosyltransferase EpsF